QPVRSDPPRVHTARPETCSIPPSASPDTPPDVALLPPRWCSYRRRAGLRSRSSPLLDHLLLLEPIDQNVAHQARVGRKLEAGDAQTIFDALVGGGEIAD